MHAARQIAEARRRDDYDDGDFSAWGEDNWDKNGEIAEMSVYREELRLYRK